MSGNFPIGFLIWKTEHSKDKKTNITEISTEVLDKEGIPIGEKTYFNLPNSSMLNLWLPRLKTNTNNIPLKNAIHPQIAKAKVTSWKDDAIGYFWCNGNDMQQASQTAIFSSVFSAGN